LSPAFVAPAAIPQSGRFNRMGVIVVALPGHATATSAIASRHDAVRIPFEAM
jgi:hypothetical protein